MRSPLHDVLPGTASVVARQDQAKYQVQAATLINRRSSNKIYHPEENYHGRVGIVFGLGMDEFYLGRIQGNYTRLGIGGLYSARY